MNNRSLMTEAGIITIEHDGTITGAANINRVFSLPMIPGFPDYRACPNTGRVISLQLRIAKELVYSSPEHNKPKSYHLWSGGQSAYITRELIVQMIARSEKPKRGFSEYTDSEQAPANRYIVIKDGAILGDTESMPKAESQICQPGNYIIAQVKSVVSVKLQAKPLDWHKNALPYYGIDDGITSSQW